MTRYHILTTIDTSESLKKTWHKIYTYIITAALKNIPNKKYTTKNYFHAFTPKATHLHKDLKAIGNIIYRVRKFFSHQITLPYNLNDLINQINTKHDFAISPPPTQLEGLAAWINNTKTYWKTLYIARNLENAKHLRKHINNAIEKRCERLLT